MNLISPVPTTPMDGAIRPAGTRPLRRLGLALVGMEVLFLALMAIAPVGGMIQTISPLARVWPWLLTPARLVFGSQHVEAKISAERGWPALAVYAALLVLASGVAVLATRAATRIHDLRSRHLAFILAGACLLGITLALLPALPSGDVFSYILYGRIITVHHANPLIVTPSQFPRDPFLSLVFWQGVRSVYGPVWLDISAGVTALAQALGGSLATYVGLFKLVGLLAHLANTALIWGILGILAPARRLWGTLLYAWNPLCLLEFCASGHNDAIMLTFALAGVYLLMRDWEAPALVAFAFSIGTKYVLIAVLPVYFAMAVRESLRRHDWKQAAWQVGWRLGIVLLVLVAVTAPYWSGARTLEAIAFSPPAQRLDNSLLDAISWPLRSIAQLCGLSRGAAASIVDTGLKITGAMVFAGIVFRWMLRARGHEEMLRGWAAILFWYSVVAAGWFWPWYVTWPVAFAALLPWDTLSGAILLLATGVLTEYAFLPLYAAPIYGLRAWLAFGPALLYLMWRERTALHTLVVVMLRPQTRHALGRDESKPGGHGTFE